MTNTWFAWYPVRLINGRWVWLKSIKWREVELYRSYRYRIYNVRMKEYYE